MSKLIKSFKTAPKYSIKWSNYFEIYERLFGKFINKKITFVEIGIGDGSENNTRLLLENGWTGTWVDGGTKSCEIAEKTFEGIIITIDAEPK